MQSIYSNIIGSLILSIGSLIYSKIVLKDSEGIFSKKYLIALLITTSVYTIVYLNVDGGQRTIINFITYVIVYKKLYDISASKSILLTFMYAIILAIPDMISLFFSVNVLGYTKEYVYGSIAGSAICNTLVCICFVGLTLILRKGLQKLFEHKLENNIINIIYSVGTFLCIVFIFFKIIQKFQIITNANIAVLIGMIIIFVAVLISFYKERIKKEKFVGKYEKMLEFIKTYETEIENQRINNHEIKNQFTTIKSMLLDKVVKNEIIDYIDEIYGDVRKIKNQEYAKLKYLPPNGIKGLLYFKIDEAQRKGIKVTVNISSKIENSVLAELSTKNFKDLGKILGVFLDNAIEASKLSKEKILGIELYPGPKGVEIIMSNSYVGFISDKMGKVKYSTKGKERGHGLLLVNNILSGNSIFEIDKKVVSIVYVQTITIKKTKKR